MDEIERQERLKDKETQRKKLKRVWRGMIERCNYPKNISYKNYGARGISVCTQWSKEFICFYEWAMKSGYKEGLTIDRINSNGNYCPENCRWATPKEQCRNKRTSVFINTPIGRMTVAEYSEKTGVNPFIIYSRIRRGTPENEIFKVGKIKNALRGEKSPLAKLTWEKVREIRMKSKEGESACSLAKIYGVSKKVILNIIHNKTWIENEGEQNAND